MRRVTAALSLVLCTWTLSRGRADQPPERLPAPRGGTSVVGAPTAPVAGPYQPLPSSRRALAPEAVMGVPAGAEVDAGLLDAPTSPISLDAAFQLAGVQNPQLQITILQVSESIAQRQFAAAQILPTLNAGSNYDNHTGNLQQSNGTILAVNRSACMPVAGASAIAAGTVNIPGLVWNMNLSNSAFNILQSRQLVTQREFDSAATRNQVMLQVAVAYYDLLRAEEARAIAIGVRDNAREVARLTANYAETGQGKQADADRAATELRQRESDILGYDADIITTAARLAQILNLDPTVRLQPIDSVVVPYAIVPDSISLPELIAIGLMQRPEMAAQRGDSTGVVGFACGEVAAVFAERHRRLQRRHVRRR